MIQTRHFRFIVFFLVFKRIDNDKYRPRIYCLKFKISHTVDSKIIRALEIVRVKKLILNAVL